MHCVFLFFFRDFVTKLTMAAPTLVELKAKVTVVFADFDEAVRRAVLRWSRSGWFGLRTITRVRFDS